MIKITQYILLVLSLSVAGCKRFVSIPPPVNRLVTKSVFNNNLAATSALLSVYSQMKDESFNMSLNTGLMSDELRNFSVGPNNISFYTNAVDPSQNLGPWLNGYSYIYQANAILEGLQNNEISDVVRRQIAGEAKFIRGFWHFYISNLYGNIPLVLSTNYAYNALIHQSNQKDVYAQIIQDLNDASILLNSEYVDKTDTSISTMRVRPNISTANAMLARVYLYDGRYDSAIAASTRVINNTSKYALESDLNNVFLTGSKEAIWQLAIPTPNTYNTSDGFNYILVGDPSIVALSQYLVNDFEEGDNRRKVWVDSVSTSTGTYYFPKKYKIKDGSSISEYVMVFRLAEQFLIRAESFINVGDLASAVKDLNTLRNRAGLPAYNGNIDKGSLLSAILHERKVELFTEWGHRWFDLIRTNSIDSVLGAPRNISVAKGGQWNVDGHQKFLPIWQSELMADPNLLQNDGY